jgi:hypothetical protein
MNNIIKIILAVSLLGSAACWSAETNTANTTNTATVANTANSADTTNTANPPSETELKVSGSPTETLKALNEASKAKNPEAIKKTLSKGTIALINESAANQKKTVDELLKEDDGAPFKELPEIRNEQINGNTATVEVKNKVANEWEKIPFVVEDGEWKVALDKYLDELEKKFAEEQGKNPPKK